MSPHLLCQSSCVMLVTSLKPNFSQVVSVPHFQGAWPGCSSLIAEMLKTLTSATEVNGGKCFENSKYYTSVSNFSSQAGPVVSSNDRLVSSTGTTTSSKYSHGMEQNTVDSRAIWIARVWHIQIVSDSVGIFIYLVIRTVGKTRFSAFQIHPNIHIFNLNFSELLFCVLRIRIAFLSHYSDLSRSLSGLQLDLPRSMHKVTMTPTLPSCRPIYSLQS